MIYRTPRPAEARWIALFLVLACLGASCSAYKYENAVFTRMESYAEDEVALSAVDSIAVLSFTGSSSHPESSDAPAILAKAAFEAFTDVLDEKGRFSLVPVSTVIQDSGYLQHAQSSLPEGTGSGVEGLTGIDDDQVPAAVRAICESLDADGVLMVDFLYEWSLASASAFYVNGGVEARLLVPPDGRAVWEFKLNPSPVKDASSLVAVDFDIKRFWEAPTYEDWVTAYTAATELPGEVGRGGAIAAWMSDDAGSG